MLCTTGSSANITCKQGLEKSRGNIFLRWLRRSGRRWSSRRSVRFKLIQQRLQRFHKFFIVRNSYGGIELDVNQIILEIRERVREGLPSIGIVTFSTVPAQRTIPAGLTERAGSEVPIPAGWRAQKIRTGLALRQEEALMTALTIAQKLPNP